MHTSRLLYCTVECRLCSWLVDKHITHYSSYVSEDVKIASEIYQKDIRRDGYMHRVGIEFG